MTDSNAGPHDSTKDGMHDGMQIRPSAPRTHFKTAHA